ncbi:MAG TPA: ribosome maturation factor RimP [Bacillota bacterium]|nr:ribosome maturation factor RimP [Bacillota bacterium]
MKNKDITQVVEEMVKPIAGELDLEVVEVEFVKEGPNWYLRVFLDKEGGLDIEDCSLVSNRLSTLLDEEDPIPQAYMLEVSSPGLDRPLKTARDFIKYSGRTVRAKTFAPVEGSKELVGRLNGLENGEILVETTKGVHRIPQDKVASIRLEIEF